MSDPEFAPPSQPEQPPDSLIGDTLDTPLPELFERIQGGDRQAAAEFIARTSPLIRRRFRGKIARSLRTLFDSDDLVATISRRLDDIVRRKEVTATSEAQFWSLLARLATNAVSEHARRALRGSSFEAGAAVSDVEPKPDADALESLLNQCLIELNSEIDQRVLRMRVDHRTHAQIAASEGISVEAARQRWQRIRRAIRISLHLLGVREPRPLQGRTKHPEGLSAQDELQGPSDGPRML